MSSPEEHRDIDQHELLSSETALEIVKKIPDPYEGYPSFNDFGGLDKEIAQLRQSVMLAQHTALCKRWDVDPVKGIMLCGPGGVGKTALVSALARETESTLEIIQPSAILSKWVGEPVQFLNTAFNVASNKKGKVILFFDEFDGLFTQNASGNSGVQASLVSEMKTQMNDIEDNVLVIAATNNLGNFDPALLRAGRFDTVIQIPLPNPEARRSIFVTLLYKNDKLYDLSTIADVMEELVHQTDGMSGADIKNILKTTRTKRLLEHLGNSEKLRQVNAADILGAIYQHRTSRPSS